VLLSLAFLIFVAYRGFSVILFAPLAALLPVLISDPADVPTVFTGLFMEKMVVFIKLYFPVFLLGALFGKMIELAGFSQPIVAAVIRLVGRKQAILSIVLVGAILTYGGVSLFVAVFAVYPFAAEMFRQSNIPKRLIGGTIALGAFTFTMDSLPGTPQIQNIIPTTFFKTNTWAAPSLGVIGSIFILTLGILYLNWRARSAAAQGEGYGGTENVPLVLEQIEKKQTIHPLIALLPLILVGVSNLLFTFYLIPSFYGAEHSVMLPGLAEPLVSQISSVKGVWAVEAALLIGILSILILAFRQISVNFAEGSKAAIGGALLASLNTASEYGFGAVISSLAGFVAIKNALLAIPNPLVNEAVTVTVLAGVTGSASGGLSIALAAMADKFIATAQTYDIPLQVLHRVASMASGGMDTLPHNGAVITLLAVTGLTHKQAYKDIFAITCIKTLAVFFVILVYYTTGII
jgi:H+/gluconate symporter-like permease